MSQYVRKLEKVAGEMIGIDNHKNFLEKIKQERANSMLEYVKKIFEDGIIPPARKRGYEITIRRGYGHPNLEWEKFCENDELRYKVFDFNRRYDAFTDQEVNIGFYLGKKGEDYWSRGIGGKFVLSESGLKINLEMHVSEFQLGMHPKKPSKEDAALLSKDIDLRNMESEVDRFISAYEGHILPKYAEQRVRNK